MKRLAAFASAVLAALLLQTSNANAATVPDAPVNVKAATTSTSATIKWSAPAGTVTGYYVARDGVDANGGGPYSKVVTSTTRSFTFTLLKPGDVYKLTVAARNTAGQGTSVVRTVTLATPFSITLVSSSMSAFNANNPLYTGGCASGCTSSPDKPEPCYLYHWSSDICGGFYVLFATKGYTLPRPAPGSESLNWRVYADTSRTFGCYNTTSHAFTSKTTVVDHQIGMETYGGTFGYVSLDSAGVDHQSPFYDFSSMPGLSALACSSGSYAASLGIHVTNVHATLQNETATGQTMIGSLTVPGEAYSPPAVFSVG